MKTEKSKDGMFIQVGQRKNGRFYKNEEYTLEEFLDVVIERYGVPPESTWFERMFQGKEKYNEGFYDGLEDASTALLHTIHQLVRNDTPGRKKK